MYLTIEAFASHRHRTTREKEPCAVGAILSMASFAVPESEKFMTKILLALPS